MTPTCQVSDGYRHPSSRSSSVFPYVQMHQAIRISDGRNSDTSGYLFHSYGIDGPFINDEKVIYQDLPIEHFMIFQFTTLTRG